ncbi:MAG: MFS transporter [Lysinibacillus sp.]
MNVHQWMSARYFVFFMSWGIFLPYWTGWLVDEKGMTIAQAASIMSIGLVARGLSTMFMFPYLARVMSSRAMLQLMALGTLFAIILYIPASSYSSLLIITLVIHVFYPTLMPALDSAASYLVISGELKHYGKSRSWGSIGFVVCGMLLTVFVSQFGNGVIVWGMLGIVAILTVMLYTPAPSILTQKPDVKNAKLELFSLFKIQHLPLVFVIVFLLQGQHATYYNYGYLYLQNIGSPIIIIGVILNIAVIAEIIFFGKADRLFANVKVSTIFIIAGVGSFIRWVLVYVFPHVAVFSVSQIFHAFSFAMSHYAFIQFTNKYVPRDKIALVQGMYSAIALSFSTAILTLLGGRLYEIEPSLAFIGMVICTVPAICLSLWLKVRMKLTQ